MDGITYPASAIRAIRSAIRRTGATTVILDLTDGGVHFAGQDKEDKVRVAGVVDAAGEVSFTTKPKKVAKKGQ